MNKTIFHDIHVSLGAKMAPFGGYLMPILYEGIVAEHTAARTMAAIFDTCHMGEFHISGATAAADLENLLTCRVSTLAAGQCRYGLICNPQGGVIDDQIIYRLGENDFLMVVNAGTQENDFAWVAGHLGSGTRIENVSADTAKLDIQGPQSARILTSLIEEPFDDLGYYRFKHVHYHSKRVLMSRTGYTGEIGFELYSDPDTSIKIWNDCLARGVRPAGLGARDTLRLEMGFPLYGHELSADRNAAESGFSFAICRDKRFIGSEIVLDDTRVCQRLVGLKLRDRRAAREHDQTVTAAGSVAGTVTSGSFAPSLGVSVAMAYVDRAHALPGARLIVRTGRNELEAEVCATPFYKNATGRAALAKFL